MDINEKEGKLQNQNINTELLQQACLQQNIANSISQENFELQQRNNFMNKKVFDLELKVKKMESKNELQFRLPSAVYYDTYSKMLINICGNGKIHEPFANMEVIEAYTIVYDPLCNKEKEVVFSVKLTNKEEICKVIVTESNYNKKNIIKEFRDQANVSFYGHNEIKDGILLINFLATKKEKGATYNIPFHGGWDNNGNFLYIGKNSNSPVPESYLCRRLEKNLENLTSYKLNEQIYELFFNAFKGHSLTVPLILFLWLHFTLMLTLFKDAKIEIHKILLLSGLGVPCKEILEKFLSYYSNKQASVISLNTTMEKLKTEIIEAKDETNIFCDCDTVGSDAELKKIKSNKFFIARMYTEADSFQVYYNIEKVTRNIKVTSTAAIVSNSIHYELDAEKFLKLHINNQDFDIDILKKTLCENNDISYYVADFVDTVEQNIGKVKKLIKESYLNFCCNNKYDFDKDSSTKTFAVLMTTWEILTKHHLAINFDFQNLLSIDVERTIADLLIENELSHDLDGTIEMMRDLFSEVISSREAVLIDNNKKTANKDMIIDNSEFNIYYDDEFYCIKLDTFEKSIMPKTNLSMNSITILSSLSTAKAIKLYSCSQNSYECKVTMYAGSNHRQKKSRQNMICIYRGFIDEEGTLPLIFH